MPARREHLKAARVLLGWSDPLVHRLMDEAPARLGARHRYLTHNAEYLVALEKLLGKEARLEATLHLLQDWQVVVPADYCGVTRRAAGGKGPGKRARGPVGSDA